MNSNSKMAGENVNNLEQELISELIELLVQPLLLMVGQFVDFLGSRIKIIRNFGIMDHKIWIKTGTTV